MLKLNEIKLLSDGWLRSSRGDNSDSM